MQTNLNGKKTIYYRGMKITITNMLTIKEDIEFNEVQSVKCSTTLNLIWRNYTDLAQIRIESKECGLFVYSTLSFVDNVLC